MRRIGGRARSETGRGFSRGKFPLCLVVHPFEGDTVDLTIISNYVETV